MRLTKVHDKELIKFMISKTLKQRVGRSKFQFSSKFDPLVKL